MSPLYLLLLYYSDGLAPLLSKLAVCIKQKSCRPVLIYLKRTQDRGLRQMRVQECCRPGPRARGRRLASAWARDLDRAALLAGSGGRPAIHGLLSRLGKENSPESRAWRTAAAATSSMGRSRMKPPLRAVSPERRANSKPDPLRDDLVLKGDARISRHQKT
jgi:hypothetical protein